MELTKKQMAITLILRAKNFIKDNYRFKHYDQLLVKMDIESSLYIKYGDMGYSTIIKNYIQDLEMANKYLSKKEIELLLQ